MNHIGTIIFDIDGTICPIKEKHEQYEDLVPYNVMVEKMNELKNEGFKIVLFTARNMKTYNGNIGLINANTAKVLLLWLDKWNIPYDEIIYGKPWPTENGLYVDDRAVRPNELIKHSIEDLKIICKNSKLGD